MRRRSHGRRSSAPDTEFLALGDSYTIGEGVAESGRWPVQLARALRDEGIALDDPRIIATTGWTTDELSAAIDAAEPLGRLRSGVSLLIGVNNQYRGRDARRIPRRIRALLERAIGFAGGRADRVLVLSIPDWGVTRFARPGIAMPICIARELDAYNAAARGICAARGVAFVDIAGQPRASAAQRRDAGRRRPASVGRDVRGVDRCDLPVAMRALGDRA